VVERKLAGGSQTVGMGSQLFRLATEIEAVSKE
jgi:hypothetical protein